MGSAEGVLKTAAARTGLGVNEYIDRLNKGLLYCWRCQDWHEAEEFGKDSTRWSGRASSCRRSKNAASKRTYKPKPRWIGFRGLQLRKSDDGGVTFSVGGNTETLTEAQARQCAAVVVALADGPPEPDPAEVDEIAALIYAGLYPGYAEPPGERARDAARAVLLRLRDRGPRDA